MTVVKDDKEIIPSYVCDEMNSDPLTLPKRKRTVYTSRNNGTST